MGKKNWCFAQHDSKFSIKFQKGQNYEKPRANQGQKKGLQRAAPTESSTVPKFLCSNFHAKGMYFKLWDNVKKELKTQMEVNKVQMVTFILFIYRISGFWDIGWCVLFEMRHQRDSHSIPEAGNLHRQEQLDILWIQRKKQKFLHT